MPAIRMRRVRRSCHAVVSTRPTRHENVETLAPDDAHDTTNTPVAEEETFPSSHNVCDFHRSWRLPGQLLPFGGIDEAYACGVVPGRFGIGG